MLRRKRPLRRARRAASRSFTSPTIERLEDRRVLTLLMTEIMYNPNSLDGSWEWLEVHNSGNAAVDLSGYVMDDNATAALIEANISSGSIAPQGTAVLYNSLVSANDFTAAWGVGLNLIPVDNWPSLNNGGDSVGLWSGFADYSGDNVTQTSTIARVEYTDDPPWPADDGAASIYLTDVGAAVDDGANWALSTSGTDNAYSTNVAAGNTGMDVGSPGLVPGVPLPAGVTISQTDGSTLLAEGGQDDTYDIALRTIPTAPVEITITADAETEVSTNGVDFQPTLTLSLTDTTANTITVRAIDDADAEGGHTGTITNSITGVVGDADYGLDLPIASVLANISDNDLGDIDLIFSEVMYNPDSDDGDWEWVEIYNRGEDTVDLSGYVIDDSNSNAHNVANIAAGQIPAGEAAVLYNSTLTNFAFTGAWGPIDNLISVEGWSNMGIGNSGDKISLWDSLATYTGDHQDHVNALTTIEFTDEPPWPADNGSASIYLLSVSASPTDGSNWALSVPGQDGAITSSNQDGNLGADVGSPGTVPAGVIPPGITIVPTGDTIEVGEDGDLEVYGVKLDTVPASPVEITAQADDQVELSLDGMNYASSVTFSLVDTVATQITVRAIDDDVTENVHLSPVAHAITASQDPDYAVGTPVDPIEMTVRDNDPLPSDLIISEIMYNPSGNETFWEWVELYNTGSSAVDLTGYVLDDNNANAHMEANIPAGTIGAGEVAVLISSEISAEDFTDSWGGGINLISVNNWADLGLSNGGDQVSLWPSFDAYQNDHQDHDNTLVSVNYEDNTPWPIDDGMSSIYLPEVVQQPRVFTDRFDSGAPLSWGFVSDTGPVDPANPTNTLIGTDTDQMIFSPNAAALPNVDTFVAGYLQNENYTDVRARVTVFPPDTNGMTPTVGGGVGSSNNDQFVSVRVSPDGLSGYLMAFDYGTRLLNLVRSDNGVLYIARDGVDGDNVRTQMGDDIVLTEPYVIEMEAIGESITGRVFSSDGNTLLYELNWDEPTYDVGTVGFGAAINDDLAPPNGDTATLVSAGFDDFTAHSLVARGSDGYAWQLSSAGIDGAFESDETDLPAQNPGTDVGSPGFVNVPAGDTVSPTVVEIQINNIADPPDRNELPQPSSWSTQQSDLRQITVVLNETIQATAADLRLTNLGLNAPDDPDEVVALDNVSVNGNVLTLDFGPYELADGVYQLELLASITDLAGNALDGNADGTGGDAMILVGSADNGLYKSLGDTNGDGGTSVFDFPPLSYWFGAGIPEAPAYLDMNNDMGISIFDIGPFAQKFGALVVFPAARPLLAAAPTEDAPAPLLVENQRVLSAVPISRPQLEWNMESPRQADATTDNREPGDATDNALAELLDELFPQ